MPIGVFDSGTGGLTVLEAILKLDAFNNKTGKPGADGVPDFAKESFQYLADQANMPYGNYAAVNKTSFLQEQVIKNISFLGSSNYKNIGDLEREKLPVKMIVVACNTATAYALDTLQKILASTTNLPCIGVINAGAKAALLQQKKQRGTIGIFATAGTVASNGYPRTIIGMAKKMGLENIETISQGGVGLAESIDNDYDYIEIKADKVRRNYKGPSMLQEGLKIDSNLLPIYKFSKANNALLCEYDATTNRCLDMQLNDASNYVRYHLVTLLEKLLKSKYKLPMNTLILGCTHYPYLKDTIAKVLNELYLVKKDGKYKYRTVLAKNVALIDPSVETAKEAYIALRTLHLEAKSKNKLASSFYISVPNKALAEVKLQQDGWFTYEYKYGRNIGQQKQYVLYQPFSNENIAKPVYERIQKALPNCTSLILLQ